MAGEEPARHGEIVVAIYRPPMPYLERQLRSIQDQTVTHWTCHLGIDGADPDTENLLRELIGDDVRFVIHHFPDNVGYYRNFERLLGLTDPGSAWIALADQDDAWDGDKLAVLIPALADDGVHLATCQARIVDGAGRVLGTSDRREVDVVSLLLDNEVTGSLAVLRPDVVWTAIPFPEPTAAAFHDHWLGVVAARMGGYRILPDVVQSYVQHSANVIGEEAGGRIAARWSRLTARGLGEAARVLADERWGWRQRMAAEVLRRVPDEPAPATAVLADIARGRLTGRVVRAIGSAAAAREVAPTRAGGLAAGLVISRLRRGHR